MTGDKNESGTLAGFVYKTEGNCMPGPNSEPCPEIPIAIKIYITEPGKTYDPEALIKTIKSNAEGFFRAQLQPGVYSLFIEDGNQIVCDYEECPSDCFCHPIEIKAKTETETKLKLDKAVY
jgi:hypothetical protein